MNKKLKLGDLSVKSFVTTQLHNEMKTIKGGSLSVMDYDSDGPPHTSSTWTEVHMCATLMVEKNTCIVPNQSNNTNCPIS